MRVSKRGFKNILTWDWESHRRRPAPPPLHYYHEVTRRLVQYDTVMNYGPYQEGR